MDALLWVDGLFAEFCSTFSGPLKEEARRLPFTLGFTRDPGAPWSHVFTHEVTLAAPVLVAAAMPQLPERALRDALFGHALAVIEAMGIDRIEDGQVKATPALRKVLEAARARRDKLLRAVLAGAPMPLDPAAADRELLAATAQEREILIGRRRVSFEIYEAISERKQAPGMLACAALAVRAGLGPTKAAALRRALMGAAMGLQLYDDVVDWEEDAGTGRSWAVALSRSLRRTTPSLDSAPAGSSPMVRQIGPAGSSRDVVHATAVLAQMLSRSRFHFHSASRRAAVLGARRLAAWAAERASSIGHLADREARNAGYVNRARELASWARVVLDPGA